MSCPPTAPVPSCCAAHDTRDWEFAKKFGLPIIEVVKGNTESNLDEAAFTDVATGTLVNSGFLDGLSVTDAQKKMIEWLEANGKGCDKVNYKLRDWVFSRQRYWGEPFPNLLQGGHGLSAAGRAAAAGAAADRQLRPDRTGRTALGTGQGVDDARRLSPRSIHDARIRRIVGLLPALHGSAQRPSARGPRRQRILA